MGSCWFFLLTMLVLIDFTVINHKYVGVFLIPEQDDTLLTFQMPYLNNKMLLCSDLYAGYEGTCSDIAEKYITRVRGLSYVILLLQ